MTCPRRKISILATRWIAALAAGIAAASGLQVWLAPSSHAGTRHVSLCFTNSATEQVKIVWIKYTTVNGGRGPASAILSQGEKTCAEGKMLGWTSTLVGIPDSKRVWSASNPPIGRPGIGECAALNLNSCLDSGGLAPWRYSWSLGQNEHACYRAPESSGTWFRISRETNDNWIQFRIRATPTCKAGQGG